LTLRLNYDKYGKHQMTTLTTNRFITKALRTLCCAGALATCSAWATVVTWQLNAVTTKDLSQSASTNAARGFDNTTVTDASHQFLFRSASESGAARETVNTSPQASYADVQLASQATLSQRSKQQDESLLFAASNTPARPTTELDEAMAKTFDEGFVSVPTVQFASMAAGSRDVSGTSIAASSIDPVPVPEMSALFPIVGLIAAVSCTQILRRRRAAQQSASRGIV
jgi:hypothetical protein